LIRPCITAIIRGVAPEPSISGAAKLPPYQGTEVDGTSGMVIATQLREAILHDYADGEMIGSEDDLIARFGVSRPTMRQAVRILQAEGLITVRRGLNGGMFASVPSADAVARAVSLLLRHRGATMSQLLNAIAPMAEAVMRTAAAHPDDDARARVAEAVLTYVAPPGLDEHEQAMMAADHFGREIGTLIENPVLALVSVVLLNLFRGGLSGSPTRPEEYLEVGRNYHETVAEAIRAGDPTEAARLTRDAYLAVSGWFG
jgi:DNA-binding FadR family transcriptional regulator